MQPWPQHERHPLSRNLQEKAGAVPTGVSGSRLSAGSHATTTVIGWTTRALVNSEFSRGRDWGLGDLRMRGRRGLPPPPFLPGWVPLL